MGQPGSPIGSPRGSPKTGSLHFQRCAHWAASLHGSKRIELDERGAALAAGRRRQERWIGRRMSERRPSGFVCESGRQKATSFPSAKPADWQDSGGGGCCCCCCSCCKCWLRFARLSASILLASRIRHCFAVAAAIRPTGRHPIRRVGSEPRRARMDRRSRRRLPLLWSGLAVLPAPVEGSGGREKKRRGGRMHANDFGRPTCSLAGPSGAIMVLLARPLGWELCAPSHFEIHRGTAAS